MAGLISDWLFWVGRAGGLIAQQADWVSITRHCQHLTTAPRQDQESSLYGMGLGTFSVPRGWLKPLVTCPSHSGAVWRSQPIDWRSKHNDP